MCLYACIFQLSCNLALVLLHDLLYGKGIQCGGPLKFIVKRHRADLIHSLTILRQEDDDSQSCKCTRHMHISHVNEEFKRDCRKVQ